jgi:hypothetical protein
MPVKSSFIKEYGKNMSVKKNDTLLSIGASGMKVPEKQEK